MRPRIARCIVGLVAVAVAILNSQAQTFSRVFESTQFPGTEYSGSVVELPGGDYAVVVNSSGLEGPEVVFARLNPSGSIRSQRSFLKEPNPEEQLFFAAWTLGLDQSIFVAANRRTVQVPQMTLDPVVAKFDLDGQPLWAKAITVDIRWLGLNLLHQPLAGGAVAFVIGKQVVFLSATGDLEASYYLPVSDSPGFSYVIDIAPSPSGTGIVLLWDTGNGSGVPNNGDPEFHLLQLENDGSIPWQKTYRTALAAQPRTLTRAPNGDLYVIYDDYRYRPPTGIGVVKLDPVGSVLWARRVDEPYPGSSSGVYSYGASATADGGIAVFCLSFITSGPGSVDDTWLFALGPTGIAKWYRHIGEWLGPNRPADVLGTADGGVLLASNSDITPGIDVSSRVLITRLDQAGLNFTALCSQIRPTTSRSLQTTVTAGSLFVAAQPVSADVAPYQWIEGSAGIQETLKCSGLPAEVAAPGALEPLRFANREELVWESAAASNSSTFNVLRGTAATLASNSGGSCLASGLTASSHIDTLRPNIGESLTYLVQGRNSVGVGILGRSSAGAVRTSSMPCP